MAGGKELNVPNYNLVLLWDHPAGRNKIQDKYKPDLYEVLNPIKDRKNAYWIQPVKGKTQSHKWLIDQSCLILAWLKGKKVNSYESLNNLFFTNEAVAQPIPNFQATHKSVQKGPRPKEHEYNLRS